MEKKYCRGHIGEEYITNEGYTAKIIDGGSKRSLCTIQIDNWIGEVSFGDLKRKGVKYPYHPSIYKGYYGEGRYKSRINGKKTKCYTTWYRMLIRCYNPEYQLKNPTYLKCYVCNEWLNYQNFAKWFYGNYHKLNGIKLDLDKDLMVKGNKIYSPETCKFIPHYTNSFLANDQRSNTTGYIGVTLNKNNTYRARITDMNNGKRLDLGSFKDPVEASNAYKDARKIQCINVYYRLIKDGITDQEVLDKFKKADL